MRITFNRFAELELNEAIDFYEREQAGLGRAFVLEVMRSTDLIREYPEAGQRFWVTSADAFAADFPTHCSTAFPGTRFGCSLSRTRGAVPIIGLDVAEEGGAISGVA